MFVRKILYKYPQAAFPYQQLIDENHKRGLNDPEFELIDTGILPMIATSMCPSNMPKPTLTIFSCASRSTIVGQKRPR